MDYICMGIIEMKLMNNKSRLNLAYINFQWMQKLCVMDKKCVQKYTNKTLFKYFCNIETLKRRNIPETFR